MSTTRILIVEDEFLIRLTLSEALQDEGFDVSEAGDAEEALQRLRADPGITLLITDIQLPGGMDGKQLAIEARRSSPDLPIIFMTGRPDPSHTPHASAPELVIAKPYLPSEICAAARRLTAR